MNRKKELEELKLDLIEVKKYRELQDKEFSFDGVNTIRNDRIILEDAYYGNMQNNILEAIYYAEKCKRR